MKLNRLITYLLVLFLATTFPTVGNSKSKAKKSIITSHKKKSKSKKSRHRDFEESDESLDKKFHFDLHSDSDSSSDSSSSEESSECSESSISEESITSDESSESCCPNNIEITQQTINQAYLEDEDPSSRITLSDPEAFLEIDEPDTSIMQEILSNMYDTKGKLLEEMKNYVVGIRGQNRLMTLAEAYQAKLLTPTGAGAILYKVKTFEEGETSTLKLKFGLRRGEDLVIGRYPSSMIARPYGNEAFIPGDLSLGPMVKWLEIMGHMTWINPLGAGNTAGVNPTNQYGYEFSLAATAASIATNHFSEEHQRSIHGGAYASAMGAGGSAGTSNAQSSHNVWYSVLNGWQGLGYTGLYNMEEQQLGLSALGVGTFVAGWKSYVQFGASLNAVFANGNQVGIGGVMTLSKDRITTYLHRYNGEYDALIDEFIKQYQNRKNLLFDDLKVTKKLRFLLARHGNWGDTEEKDGEIKKIQDEIGKLNETIENFMLDKKYFHHKHFVEVVDSKSKGFRLQGGAYVGGVGSGFRAGVNKGKQSIYRFYTDLYRAKELLKDGNGDKIALLRLPEKFDNKDFPDILNPQNWAIGEEVITTLERTYNGSIVMGVSAIPGLDAGVGLSGTVSGSFEVGIRKLPANKLELTIRPSKIKELGAFIKTINIVGPQLSVSSTVALAMRQTFIFDLDNEKSRDTYNLFMSGGVLPLDFSITDNIVGPREAENLLDIARIARENLAKKGILLTYLEKIDVPAKKFYMGAFKIPLISEKKWAGLSNEYLNGQAKVISTNGDIAISRNTQHTQTVKSRGTHGTRTEGAYGTIKRTFIKTTEIDKTDKDDKYPSEDGNLWRFKGFIIRARIADDKITDNEHNEMVDKINSMFHANVNHFKSTKGHKQTRDILLERELSSKDFELFENIKQSTILTAARASGLEKNLLNDLKQDVEEKGNNQIAEILKKFIDDRGEERRGLEAISAIHLMLNGDCRNLIIRTESSSYSDSLENASGLEALYTDNDADQSDIRNLDLKYSSTKAKIRQVYSDLRKGIKKLDQALIDLDEDPLFEEKGNLLEFGDSNLREKKITLRSKLIAAKKSLTDLLNLEKQSFPKDTILKIYSNLKDSKRDIKQKYTLLADQYKKPINLTDNRKDISHRWKAVTKLLEEIEAEKTDIDTDENRRIFGPIFVGDKLDSLADLEESCKDLISVDHLKLDGKAFIKKMRKKRLRLFPAKSIHNSIAGNVEQILK